MSHIGYSYSKCTAKSCFRTTFVTTSVVVLGKVLDRHEQLECGLIAHARDASE